MFFCDEPIKFPIYLRSKTNRKEKKIQEKTRIGKKRQEKKRKEKT